MGISHTDTMLFCNDKDTVSDALADPRGASLPYPLSSEFIFNFLQFSRKDSQNNRLVHTPPPLGLGNPRSATGWDLTY